MLHHNKIYVAGHNGMVGSAIIRKLKSEGYFNLVMRSSKELDLRNQNDVNDFFENEKPEYVFLAAAKVGGIVANNTYRAEFLYDNLMIEANVIHAAYKHNVTKLLFLGSSCIYPKFAKQPMKEESLLTGILEPTNEPYAIAKIAGIKLCENYRRQYGCDFISVMPTNLYGTGDNYNLEKSHVIPALIRKMHLGKCIDTGDWQSIRKDLDKNPIDGINGSAEKAIIIGKLAEFGLTVINNKSRQITQVTLWGTGSPLREFMHVDDLANACYYIMLNYSDEMFINIGSGEEVSIKTIAEMIKEIVGFNGELIFDTSKPDGTFRKLMDSTRLNQMGFKLELNLYNGLRQVYQEYTNF